VDNYTPAELKAFDDLRIRVGPAVGGLLDDFLYRFLVARMDHKKQNFDVEKSAIMLKSHLEWRAKNNMNRIFTLYFSPRWTELYPCGYHGKDKHGNQLYFERIGKCNVSKMFEAFGEDSLRMLHCVVVETGRRFYDRQLGGTGEGIVVVMDMNGLSYSHLDKRAYAFVNEISKIDQANYPEHLKKCFIINCPMIFTAAWKVIQAFLDQRTKEKVKLLGSSYKSELLKYIDAEQLPSWVDGGACTSCPNGCVQGYIFGNPDPSAPHGAPTRAEQAASIGGVPPPPSK